MWERVTEDGGMGSKEEKKEKGKEQVLQKKVGRPTRTNTDELNNLYKSLSDFIQSVH